MKKQRYYLVLTDSGKLWRVFPSESEAIIHSPTTYDIIPIPAEELNQLIKKYRKK